MYELTSGDQRYISDTVMQWRYSIDTITEELSELPESVKDRISYLVEFSTFYIEEMDKDDTLLAGQIQRSFEEKFGKENPDFFDIGKLFEKCSDEDKKKAEALIKAATETNSAEEL